MVRGSVVDGTVSVLVSTGDLCRGSFVVTGAYQQNDSYESASSTGNLSVLGLDVNMTLSGCSGFVGEDTVVSGVCLDENDVGVTGGSVDWSLFDEQVLDVTDISDWNYGKLSGTSVADGSLIAPMVIDGGVSTGRGYLVYYDIPIVSSLDACTVRVRCSGSSLYNRVGIVGVVRNGDGSLYGVSGDTSWLVSDLVGGGDDVTSYLLEFKFFDGFCYVFVDGVYCGVSHDFSGVDHDLFLVFYSNRFVNNVNSPVVVEGVSVVDCVDLNGVPSLGNGGGAMIRTLDTDITTNWTVIPHPTLATTPTVFNEDGTITLGLRQHNLISIPDKTKQHRIRVHQNNVALAIGVGYFNNGTVNNVSPYLNTLFSNISTNTENEYILSFTDDGVTLSDGTDTVILTTRTNDTHIIIYNNNTTNDKLITITEETIGGGN